MAKKQTPVTALPAPVTAAPAAPPPTTPAAVTVNFIGPDNAVAYVTVRVNSADLVETLRKELPLHPADLCTKDLVRRAMRRAGEQVAESIRTLDDRTPAGPLAPEHNAAAVAAAAAKDPILPDSCCE